MVVRVHRLIFAALSAQHLVRQIGDHLVGIHVVRGACASLEGVHNELIVPPPGRDFAGRLNDGSSALGIELAKVHVHLGGGLFHNGSSHDIVA